MRKLHLVGLTTDRDGLIFTARKGSKSGGFIVPLDDRVLAAIAEAREVPNGAPAEAEGVVAEVPKRLRSQSALTPREMQARLRAGRSIEEVAAEAGVDTEWVARFAVPILAEQAQVVELARSLVYAKPRLGESSQPLGASVVQNLADRGVFLPDDVADAGWSAFQLHDSVWMVRFRYRSRGRDQEAQWEVDVPSGRLVARNRHASDLGYVDPNRRRRDMDVEDNGAEEPVPDTVARRARRRAAKVEPRSEPAAQRTTRRGGPALPATPPRTTPARPTTGVKAGKTAKAAKAPKRPKTATGAKAAKATKPAPTTKTAKSPTRRRPAKAAPGPEAGPTAGSGGVRMAVAQVSTARVAASLASADREPWAEAVRRSRRPAPPSAAPPAETGRAPRRPVTVDVDLDDGREEATAVPPFQPRPLPAGGDRSMPPRVRRVTVPRTSAPTDDAPAVTLPAPRRPGPRQEPMPVERVKRRRLRSR
ncbi:MAG TPA: septation protein SepH [Acidimicrobiales bacterium]|nr:septation protein SepH [Acidimicrobiales bacterium]